MEDPNRFAVKVEVPLRYCIRVIRPGPFGHRTGLAGRGAHPVQDGLKRNDIGVRCRDSVADGISLGVRGYGPARLPDVFVAASMIVSVVGINEINEGPFR